MKIGWKEIKQLPVALIAIGWFAFLAFLLLKYVILRDSIHYWIVQLLGLAEFALIIALCVGIILGGGWLSERLNRSESGVAKLLGIAAGVLTFALAVLFLLAQIGFIVPDIIVTARVHPLSMQGIHSDIHESAACENLRTTPRPRPQKI